MNSQHHSAYRMGKEKLPLLIKTLGRSGEVIAPKYSGLELHYLPISDASEIVLSKIPLDTPKNYIFPITEKLFEVKNSEIKSTINSEPLILFGVRPCDVAAIRCMEKFFGDYSVKEKIEDPYIMEKLRKLTIVAFNCPEPKEHCFCVAMGTGPTVNIDFDLALTDLGDAYLIEVGNDKSVEVIQSLSLPPASSEDIAKKEDIRKKCVQKMNVDFNVEGIEKIIDKKINVIAETYGKKCIVCGGCNFYCPTCSCFNVSDSVGVDGVVRERFWDSCLLKGFTWLAGSGFERETLQARMKQRLMHKLSYTKEQYDLYSCTGCGRCSEVCPSFIFMETMINDILGGK